MIDVPVPHLQIGRPYPLEHLERVILSNVAKIEGWFRQQFKETPAPITSSVDLRHSGFKLAPVDTNLFPAGFNNIHPDLYPLCIQAVQSVLTELNPHCTKILILPESHTRNRFYLQSLAILRDILLKAGFIVRLGSLDPELKSTITLDSEEGEPLEIEPLVRTGSRVGLKDFNPCLLLLNNDLSSGVPEILRDLDQPIQPLTELGWSTRLKSMHFKQYDSVATDFAKIIDLDPWLINPLYSAVNGIDFMTQDGLDVLAKQTDLLFNKIREKYATYAITEKPFVAVKADNGTYGMSVIMVHDGHELLDLNRKQRTKMSASKGSQKVSKILIQEGVYTFETTADAAVAEPVVYMIGQYVIGGFYRVHQDRGIDENLNAPGMHFEPLAFAKPCNTPRTDLSIEECPNRFYVYGVIARLAALAAAREAHDLQK